MQQVGTRLWAHHAGAVQRAAGRFDDAARWCCAGCKNETIGVKTKSDDFKWELNADGVNTPSEPRSGSQAGACWVLVMVTGLFVQVTVQSQPCCVGG
jgi:hypothetical protein